MTTLVSTVAKISKLEQIARDASASSSSDSSTSSLGTLMKAAALNPWFQEARYILEQQRAAAAAAVASATNHLADHADREKVVTSPQQSPPESRNHVVGASSSPSVNAGKSGPQATVAIFQSHQGANGEGHYVDYNSPQPVFLAPLASFTHGNGNDGSNSRPRSQSPPSMVPINMSLLSTRSSNPKADQGTFSGFPASICTTGQAIFLGKSSHYVTTQASMEPKRGMDAIEQTLAAEEEAKDEADRQAYIEEAFKCR